MTHITYIKELPWCALRAYQVKDEAEAAQIADGRRAYLFQQTEKALYVFVELGEYPGKQERNERNERDTSN